MINKQPPNWKEKPLEEVLDYEQPVNYIINTKIKSDGKTPVLTPGKSFIKGYTEESEGICNNLPIILFDDFTTSSKFVNFPFKVKSSAVKILKPKIDSANLKFIYYQMQTKEVNFTTHKRYYLSHYQKLNFLFPVKENDSLDFESQSLIVQAIESNFSKIDNAIQSLKSVKKKIGLYRKAVLKKAFEKRGNWEEKKIGDVIETTSGGTPSRGIKKYYEGDIPWLKSGELRDNTKIEDSKEHITEEAIKNSSAKIFPEKSVLIAMYGATTGKIGILQKPCSTNQAVCAFLPNKNFDEKFIFYFLLNKRNHIINQGKGGAQPNISQTVLKILEISFPPSLPSQQSIVSSIESKFSVIDKVEEAVNNSLVKAEKLKKSILKSAFEGRLVKEE